MSSGKAGIPRTAGCDDIRRNHIKTRLTDQEVLQLDAYAARLGVSRSAAIRAILLHALGELPGQSEYQLVTPMSA